MRVCSGIRFVNYEGVHFICTVQFANSSTTGVQNTNLTKYVRDPSRLSCAQCSAHVHASTRVQGEEIKRSRAKCVRVRCTCVEVISLEILSSSVTLHSTGTQMQLISSRTTANIGHCVLPFRYRVSRLLEMFLSLCLQREMGGVYSERSSSCSLFGFKGA
jgi:hypothetical protein